MTKDWQLDSLQKAQKKVRQALTPGAEGILCPCCGQKVKLYRRPLNAEMAIWLITLTKMFLKNGRRWISVKEEPLNSTRGGDYGKLQHWGLIEQRPNEDPKKRASGYWRPTKRGVLFAKNRVKVRSHVYIFNNSVRGFYPKKISITEALGKKFDYQEVVRTALGRKDAKAE